MELYKMIEDEDKLIQTPPCQVYSGFNINAGIDDHLLTQDSYGTGDFKAIVAGIVLHPSDGNQHMAIQGFKITTQANFYPNVMPLGYLCFLIRETGDERSELMEPFSTLPPANSQAYKECLKAFFPKYFFKLRAGATIEPVYVGSKIIVGYQNNKVGGPGSFRRSLDMRVPIPQNSSFPYSVPPSSESAYSNSGQQYSIDPNQGQTQQTLIED